MPDDDRTGGWSGAPASGRTSPSLLERVRARDPDAWRQLVDLCGPLIYRWCRQCGLQSTDAADVSQEVLAGVATGLADFRRDRPGDSFHGWLWTITRNKVRNHLRRLKGQVQAEGGTHAQQQLAQIPDELDELEKSWTTVPLDGNDGTLERRALDLVRAGVEDRTWQAFSRLVVDGQAAADIAAELGMTAAAVYKAKYRIMALVRRELADLLG